MEKLHIEFTLANQCCNVPICFRIDDDEMTKILERVGHKNASTLGLCGQFGDDRANRGVIV